MLKRIRSEYAGYDEIKTTRREAIIIQLRSILGRTNKRFLFLALLSFLALVQFGVSPLKAIGCSLALFSMLAFYLGSKFIERITIIAILTALLSWAEIPLIMKWTRVASATLENYLSHSDQTAIREVK